MLAFLAAAAVVSVLAGSARAAPASAVDAALTRDFPGWSVASEAAGTLSGGVGSAVAAILQKPGSGEDDGQALLVVYADSGAAEPKRIVRAEKAICIGCGGPKAAMDAPLGELKIDKGLLRIDYQGGSRDAFDDVTKWRFDRKTGAFLLIGETYTVVDSVGEEPKRTTDIDYATLRMTQTNGKRSKACRVAATFKAIELTKFDYAERHGHDLAELVTSCRLKSQRSWGDLP